MIARPEHPKPQFERENWKNLNGEWDFCFDDGRSGSARGLEKAGAAYDRKIVVPFCPESNLSGIGDTDFHAAVWYRRTIALSEKDLAGRVLLHFGAVDYACRVYVNETEVGFHRGGYVSFSLDVTDALKAGENLLVVCCEDDARDPMIPSGKQSDRYASYGCYYTRTTGIWQTVWLEFVPETRLLSTRYYPDAAASTLTVQATLSGTADLTAVATYEGREVGRAELKNVGGAVTFAIPLSETHLWEIGDGRLYDLVFTFGTDRVKSYFGLRDIRFDGMKFRLNGKSVFQRLVLDQGFYPDGVYTAPSDEELKNDILRSLAMGFNGARPHEKVFEERYLYYCDKLGYIVWGEYPNWGLDHTRPEAIYPILPEWIEEMNRDFNHPSIIGWCPFNETWDQHHCRQFDPLLSLVYRTTKAIDPTRPVIDTSGNYHVESDIHDVHDYEQNPDVMVEHFASLVLDGTYVESPKRSERQPYTPGKPFFVSEYGGIGWSVDESAWGYGNTPKTKEEFLERLKGLTDALLDNPKIFAFCYTQLTDVEQEQNGLYTYDRRPKFPPEVIRPIFSKKAAIED